MGEHIRAACDQLHNKNKILGYLGDYSAEQLMNALVHGVTWTIVMPKCQICQKPHQETAICTEVSFKSPMQAFKRQLYCLCEETPSLASGGIQE